MAGKILFLVILMIIGIILKLKGKVTGHSILDLSRINMDIFWPALIFSSIITGLDRSVLLNNMLLPFSAVVTAFTGLSAGLLICKINKWKGTRKSIFLYHSTINNFVFLVLPFVTYFLPERGAGLLFVHNLGYMIILWTIGISFMTHNLTFRQKLKQLFSNGLIATVSGIVIVLFNFNNYVPEMAVEILNTLGKCTVPVAMIIAGARIADLGIKALKFDKWNIQLGLLRLVFVPGVLAVITILLFRYTSISKELLIIFMTVNLAPVSVNAVSMAVYYNSDADLAAEGVVFTHLFSMATMIFFFWIMKDFFTSFI
ncbi:MAG: AEC family transporter [Spirochaetes bacterium]|nr:AEC family transporter [Spirochaetota bacterium]